MEFLLENGNAVQVAVCCLGFQLNVMQNRYVLFERKMRQRECELHKNYFNKLKAAKI